MTVDLVSKDWIKLYFFVIRTFVFTKKESNEACCDILSGCQDCAMCNYSVFLAWL